MKRVILYIATVLCLLSAGQISAQPFPTNIDASIALKIPGNNAVNYPLKGEIGGQSVQLKAEKDIPAVITCQAFGIVAICDLPKKRPLFIHQTAGQYVKTG